MTLIFRTILVAILTVMSFTTVAEEPDSSNQQSVYLFSSFRGNGEDGLHLALSLDGLTWTALKNDQSFLKPAIGGKLMRDPCILPGPDGVFHMVWTTSWTDKGIGLAHSRDLIEWSEQQFVPVMEHEPGAKNCWAPEIAWDAKEKQYVIFWATTLPDRFPETEGKAEKGWNHRMYYTTTKNFRDFSETKLFYEPGFNVIDCTIVKDKNRYAMVLKDETRNPPAKNLCVSFSDNLTGPWSKASKPFTPAGLWVEGPSLLRVGDGWIVYYDEYTQHRYGAMRTKDFETWENISDQIRFPKGTRHGTAFSVTKDVLVKLMDEN